jgi:hypothetical protein
MNYFYDSKQFWLSIAAINIWQIKQHEFMYTKHIKYIKLSSDSAVISEQYLVPIQLPQN